MPRFVISTLGLSRREGTRACIEAVLRHGHDFHLILTDNGSKDGTGAMMDGFAAKHSNVTVVHNATNQGFQEPNAAAFREAVRMGAEFFMCLNDDTLPQARFLEKLVEPFHDPMVAISGVSGTCCELTPEFHGQGGKRREYIEGSAFMVRVEIMQRLRNNLWCPGLRGIFGEDSSASLFVQERGYKLAFVDMEFPHSRSATVNSDPEIKRYCQEAQEHNHKINCKRWAYYLEHRRFDLPIVLRRSYAIGDVILLSPVIDAIRRSRPLSPIHVDTKFPELFASDPRVASCSEHLQLRGPHLEVKLDGAYEDRPLTHIVDAYWQATAEVVTGLEPHEWTTRLYPSPDDLAWAEQQGLNPVKTALLSTDSTTWEGKNWPSERMQQVARWLTGNGWDVVAVGSKNRATVTGWPMVKNLVGQTSLMQLAALCSRAHLMVTPDTSSLHLAQAMGCHTVGLFGVTRARYITTRGSRMAAVESPDTMAKSGARHRVSGTTFVPGGQECMEAITVEQVIEAIQKLEI